MFWQKTQVNEIINNKKRAIKDRNNKTNFDNPGEGQFQFGFSQFFFDFGILFQGELFDFSGSGRFSGHSVGSIALG